MLNVLIQDHVFVPFLSKPVKGEFQCPSPGGGLDIAGE
jgi:hypothetical protein